MPDLLTVGEVANLLSQRTERPITPKAVSDAIYRQTIPPDLVTTVADRKLLPADQLDQVLEILTRPSRQTPEEVSS